MNSSLDHQSTQRAILEQANGVQIILAVVNELYLPKDWSRPEVVFAIEGEVPLEEKAAVAMWGWRVLGEVALLETEPPVPLPSSVLPLLLPCLFSYLPLPTTLSPAPSDSLASSPSPTSTLLSADLQVLITATHLLSTQTTLNPSWEVSLANLRGVQGEHQEWDFWEGELELWADEVEDDKGDAGRGREVLDLLMDLVELASVETRLREVESEEEEEEEEDLEEQRSEWEKSMGEIKGGLVRTIVGVVGNDAVGKLLYDEDNIGGGWFVRRAGEWLELGATCGREDLTVCAILCLGNLARNG